MVACTADFAFARNWVEMIPGMVLWGFWLGQPAGSAYIVTCAEKNRLTSTFTIISAGWSFGYVFSPAVGEFLAGTVGMKTVFYLAFIFYCSACFTLSFIRSQYANREQHASGEDEYSFLKLVRNRRLLSYSVFFAMLFFVIMLFRNFVPSARFGGRGKILSNQLQTTRAHFYICSGNHSAPVLLASAASNFFRCDV